MVNSVLTTPSRAAPRTTCRSSSYVRKKISDEITIVNLQGAGAVLT